MFEYPTLFRYPFYSSPSGISYTTSPDLRGRAICTDGINGWIHLSNYTGQCPKNPEMCPNGFALTMWLMLNRLPDGVDSGYVASLGAENKGID